MSTYEEVIDYLYALLPVFHRDGSQAYRPGLQTIKNFCDHLGTPQHSFKSIHITGTNGKGSTSHWLAAIFQSAGYKTGLYTSPHLKDFRERIRIDGLMVDKNFVVDFVTTNQIFIENENPSFFEVSVAMAFAYFAVNQVDIAIIEVGLGGRLDSTNIITPCLSIITNIDWDHADILGDSLQKIAYEKAGIIKPDIPVLISERQEEVQSVFIDIAGKSKSTLFFASDLFTLTDLGVKDGYRHVEVKSNDEKRNYTLGLLGHYQLKNVKGVLVAVEHCRNTGWLLPEEAIDIGLRNVNALTGLKGRWQKIGEHPNTYCDTAHNEAGVRELLKTIETMSYRHLWMIVGFVRDKDVSGIIKLLPGKATYFICQAKNPRAMSVEEIKNYFNSNGLKFYANNGGDINDAMRQVCQMSNQSQDLLVIFGSTYLIAEINGI